MKTNEKPKKKMPTPKLPKKLSVESKAERKKEEKRRKEFISRAKEYAEDALCRARRTASCFRQPNHYPLPSPLHIWYNLAVQ